MPRLCFSYAEQLVLYMKAEEFLSAALHTAKENINKGQLLPSNTVKQGEYNDLPFFLVNVCQMYKMKEGGKWLPDY